MKKQLPPSHLSPDGKKLWQRIFDDVELDEPALLMLATMCEQFDRMNQAREILKAEGVTTKDRWGQVKPHPAISIEVSAAAAMMRAWRLLGFDQVATGPMGRPPGT